MDRQRWGHHHQPVRVWKTHKKSQNRNIKNWSKALLSQKSRLNWSFMILQIYHFLSLPYQVAISQVIFYQPQFKPFLLMSKHKKNRSRSRSRSKGRGNDKIRSDQRSRNRDKLMEKRRSYESSSSKSSSDSNYSRQQSGHQNPRDHHGEQRPQQQPRYKVEETKTLKIEKCVNREAAERALTDASINAGTSVPDEVEVKEDAIFAKYPSVEVSTKIKELLKETISIAGEEYRINFHPYRRIDLNMAYDWYCQKCDYKNFARRSKCYRCDGEKNANCKLNYNTAAVASKSNNKEENINNCSLMVRGPVITDTEEDALLSVFQSICSVKDIRMIRNKMTGQLKDFAFIQFFTPEDAALALKHCSSADFRMSGEKVCVMYSRNKSDDDYAKPLPYEKRQRRKDFIKKQKKAEEPVESYYNKQRQLEIEQQKQRPLVTIQQLKEKRQQELRKKAASARELTEEQSKRRQAEMMARQWERESKMQNTVLYICVCCRRKFKGELQMKEHQQNSELHRFNRQKLQLSL